MPSISMFYGIIVYVYYKDNERHGAPHIHARYQDSKASFSIPDGAMLDGCMPPRQTRMIQTWIDLRQDELMADWQLAVEGQEPYKIKPLE